MDVLIQEIGVVCNAIITWLLVVFGWLVVSDQNRHQELLKANHERFDSLRGLLDEVEMSSINLHAGIYDETASRRVQRMIKKVSIECKLLAECGAMDEIWRKKVIELRQAITLRNFDRSNFRTQSSSSDIMFNIERAKDGFEIYIVNCLRDGLKSERSLLSSIKSCIGHR